jgi:hypothetical protein
VALGFYPCNLVLGLMKMSIARDLMNGNWKVTINRCPFFFLSSESAGLHCCSVNTRFHDGFPHK